MNLHTPLEELACIPPQRARQLARFGLKTVGELLTHYPKRHEDRRRFNPFPATDSEEAVLVCGVVARVSARRLRGRQKMFDVLLEETEANALSPTLICRWFNSHWVEKVIAAGQQMVAYGKPKRSGSHMVIAHPEIEIIEEDAEASIHLHRLVPIHPATEGLSARTLRRLIWDALAELDLSTVPSTLPVSLDPTAQSEALRQIHFPDSEDALSRARRHLVLGEFFGMQLSIASRRAEHFSGPGAAHRGSGELMERFIGMLPFALTAAQQRSLAEISADLASNRPMNRLLHGDVGSGKTIVALSAMLLAVEAGFQTVLMAPTQILAEQHYLSFRRLVEPLGVSVALRTGAKITEIETLPLFAARGGRNLKGRFDSPQIIVGTHALLYEGAGILNLGLAVIDEQHKFGVMQRARLRERGFAPDVLVMTATPIPRTLTMTIYGDLDVSTLDELPANRGPIVTVARDPTKLPDAVKFVRDHLQAGRQAYIVYPLIDQSERLEAKAAAAEFAKWQGLLSPMRCALLHGRVMAEEKEAIMRDFRCGEIKALIATTVIEVGIDVPNATIMLVENAERFGLAQLHQLRGRIGRGPHKSYCILFSSNADDPKGQEKLQILEKTSDGFQIAEADLRLRGAGDLLGTAQSGLPPFKLGDPIADGELMRMARGEAMNLIAADPKLEHPENQRFRRLLAVPNASAFGLIS